MPVTIPVVNPTVAIAPEELVHVPPPVASARVVVEPTHTVEVPVIGAVAVLTVTTAEVVHPVEVRVNTMVVVPGVNP
jgi:protein involved in polysaccharide export with SLBB domain